MTAGLGEASILAVGTSEIMTTATTTTGAQTSEEASTPAQGTFPAIAMRIRRRRCSLTSKSTSSPETRSTSADEFYIITKIFVSIKVTATPPRLHSDAPRPPESGVSVDDDVFVMPEVCRYNS